MKTICSFILLLSILCFSCGKQEAEPMVNYSPDKQLKIVVSATRQSQLDAWMAEIELTHAGQINKVVQEFYSDEADSSSISFEWKSNAECVIHFKQRDDILIDVPVKIHY